MKARLAYVAVAIAALFLLGASIRLGLLQALMINPTAEFSYAGIFALYLCSAPSRWEAALAALAGLAIWFAARNSFPQDHDYWLEPLIRVTALMGVTGVAALALRAGFGRSRQAAVSMLIRILIFAILGVGIGQIVDLASRIRPLKFDAYLQAIEQGFGFLPNLLLARWFAAMPWLAQVEVFIYNSLPLGLALVYGAHLKWPRGKTDILFLLYMNALIGFSLYMVYPACGPIYAFGNTTLNAPLDLHPIALDCKPNAMPSLHFAGAILICWNLRWFGRARAIAFLYLILTGLATLGFREHYAMDLIAAGPYALLIQALATDARRRVQAVAVGATLLFAWLAMDRFAVPILAGSRSLLWSLSLATIAVIWASARMLMNSAAEVDEGNRLTNPY